MATEVQVLNGLTEYPLVVRKHAFIHIPITDFSPQVTSGHPV